MDFFKGIAGGVVGAILGMIVFGWYQDSVKYNTVCLTDNEIGQIMRDRETYGNESPEK